MHEVLWKLIWLAPAEAMRVQNKGTWYHKVDKALSELHLQTDL